ncbi:MAG: hypothetical protein EOM28_03170 [Clostridia bacterium]|nr:hypothetical protein [Clostridia bacterium]
MKSDISAVFKVPAKAYKFLEMIAEEDKRVDLYCMGGNEILLVGSLLEVEDDWDEDELAF